MTIQNSLGRVVTSTFGTVVLCASLNASAFIDSLLVTSPTNSISRAAATQCEISESERELLLTSSFQDFDQNLPEGGWRKYSKLGCHGLVRDLIDAYVNRNSGNLVEWQVRVLVWHSGQLTAMTGDSAGAIGRMNKTTLQSNEGLRNRRDDFKVYRDARLADLWIDQNPFTFGSRYEY